MRRARRVVVVILALNALLLPSVSGGVAQAEAPESALSWVDIDEQQRMRSALGLDAQRRLIERILDNPEDMPDDPVYGLALTAAEQQELDDRQAFRDEAVAAVRSYLDRAGTATFGGLYIDHQSDGDIFVGFTRDALRQVQEIRQGVSRPEKVKPFVAAHRLDSLEATHERIRSLIADLKGEGIQILTIATSVEQSRVDITVSGPTERASSRLGELVDPSQLHVTGNDSAPEVANRTAYRTPTAGGLDIFSLRASCTSGFVAHDGASLLLRRYYVVTAGHCFEIGEEVAQGGVIQGLMRRNNWPHGGGTTVSDTGAYDIPVFERSNDVYISNNVYRDMTRVGSAIDGDYVCKSGTTTGYGCGIVNTTSFTANYASEGVVASGQTLLEVAVDFGDSGGPTVMNQSAVGIISGKRTGADGTVSTIYSPLDTGLNFLNLFLETS